MLNSIVIVIYVLAMYMQSVSLSINYIAIQ